MVTTNQKPITKNTLSIKAVIQNGRRDKELPRQAKIKGVYHQETSSTRNAEGTYLSGKAMTTNRDKNNHIKKGNKITCKGKNIGNVADQIPVKIM